MRHAIAALLACIPILSVHAQMRGRDWRTLASTLVERMDLTKGERVFLFAEPGLADSLIPPLRAAIRAAGAEDLGALSTKGAEPASWATPWTRATHGLGGRALEESLGSASLGVMLPGATVTDSVYAAMQRVLRSGRGRTIHFHWAGAYALDGTELPVTPPRQALYESVLRSTDYRALHDRQVQFDQAMRRAAVRVTTPDGTDVSFHIGDRQVTKQDGDASLARTARARVLIDREVELPAGAIRVAPLEETVQGAIAFPAGVWGGERVEGLIMRFTNGRLVGYEATHGREGVEKELAAGGEAARSFREFALGMNPALAIPSSGEPWIPYYGYGAGVVRLSLGDNSELGGKVGGGYVRWNFFPNATVQVGNVTWVKDGVLVR